MLLSLACEHLTYFRSWLLSLFFGGREATTGNTSAVRRLSLTALFLKMLLFHTRFSEAIYVHTTSIG